MSFLANVKTMEGKVLYENAKVTEYLARDGSLLYFGVNIKDTDNDNVDEIDAILPPGFQGFFELLGPRKDDPVNMR